MRNLLLAIALIAACVSTPRQTLAAGSSGDVGKYSILTVRNVYSSTNVTTAAWVQLVSAMPQSASEIEVFDSSGQTLKIGFGASGSEVTQFQIIPGGNGKVPIRVPSGARVSIRSISGTASTGELDINFYQ